MDIEWTALAVPALIAVGAGVLYFWVQAIANIGDMDDAVNSGEWKVPDLYSTSKCEEGDRKKMEEYLRVHHHLEETDDFSVKELRELVKLGRKIESD